MELLVHCRHKISVRFIAGKDFLLLVSSIVLHCIDHFHGFIKPFKLYVIFPFSLISIISCVSRILFRKFLPVHITGKDGPWFIF